MKDIAIFIAVLPESTRTVPKYLMAGRFIVTMMTDNPNFPAPTPPLEEVSAILNVLETKEELALKGGKGMVEERDVVLRKAHNKLNMLKAHVQCVANEEPERAEAIIESAGMNVGKQRERVKQPLNAKHGEAVGRVVLDAKALPRPVQYRWQMSTDQMKWTDLPETFNTKTTVDGLSPATIYSFRLQTVTRNGPSEWSSPVTIIAH